MKNQKKKLIVYKLNKQIYIFHTIGIRENVFQILITLIISFKLIALRFLNHDKDFIPLFAVYTQDI